MAVLCGTALLLAALAVNLRVLDFGFLYLRDDDVNVTLNPHMGGIELARLRWMFTDWSYVRRYIPLGWLNFSLTYEFAGLNPKPYHAVALALYGINVALVLAVLLLALRLFAPADRDRGNIGCAIVLPNKIEEFATESATLPKLTQADLTTPSDEGLPPVANLLAIAPAQAGKPFLYYLGAGWSKSGDFPDETDWENYVRQFVAGLRTPLKVTLENE